MIKYCLGFVFDKEMSNVMLIKKNRPDWMRHKLNGIGGKVELNETFIQAMCRETVEETGVVIEEAHFHHFATMKDVNAEKFHIEVFYTILEDMYFLTLTDEVVGVYGVEDLLDGKLKTVDNLPYLVAGALTSAERNIDLDYYRSPEYHYINLIGDIK